MEQGPLLEALGIPLAPVAAIAGQNRLAVSICGGQARPLPRITSLMSPVLTSELES